MFYGYEQVTEVDDTPGTDGGYFYHYNVNSIEDAMGHEYQILYDKPLPTKTGKDPQRLSDEKYQQAKVANPRLKEGAKTASYAPGESRSGWAANIYKNGRV